MVFTNNNIDNINIKKLKETVFKDEIFIDGNECFYMYLPRDATKKKLNNNYLERQMSIVATTRKLSVVKRLYDILDY